MRKIQTKKDAEKKKKRNQTIIGIILIVVMFGSTFGIIVNSFGNQDSQNILNYNGDKFVYQNGYWFLEKGSFSFAFTYNPEEVMKTSESLSPLSSYYGKPLYISSEDYTSEIEIYRNLNQIVERFQKACTKEQNCTEDYPVKDCTENFIVIKESELYETPSIMQDGGCVFIEGRKNDLVNATDSFLYNILEINQ